MIVNVILPDGERLVYDNVTTYYFTNAEKWLVIRRGSLVDYIPAVMADRIIVDENPKNNKTQINKPRVQNKQRNRRTNVSK